MPVVQVQSGGLIVVATKERDFIIIFSSSVGVLTFCSKTIVVLHGSAKKRGALIMCGQHGGMQHGG